MGHWLLEVARVFPLILYVLLRNFFFLLQGLFWKLTSNTPPTGKSARVCGILLRHKVLSIDLATARDFLTYHQKWEDPAIVLMPNVTLYSVTTTEATFVECSATTSGLSTAHAFFYSAQFNLANRVITIPIAEFHRLADILGPPVGKQKVVHLYSVGRCGSTLLSAMMSAIPNSLSLSEPDSFTCLLGMKSQMDPAEYKRMLVSVSRMETKVIKETNSCVSVVTLKFRSQCNKQAEDVCAELPHVKQLFMYRHGEDVAKSVIRTFIDLPVVSLIFHPTAPQAVKNFMKKQLLNMTKKNAAQEANHNKEAVFSDEFMADLPVLGVFAVAWANECLIYLDMRAKKLPIVGVRYEDLVENPVPFFNCLVNNLEIQNDSAKEREKMLDDAVKATKTDSQANSGISKASQTVKQFTNEDSQAVVAVCQRCELGSPGVTLEGTLSHS